MVFKKIKRVSQLSFSLIIISALLFATANLQAQQSDADSRAKAAKNPLEPVLGWVGQWQCHGTAFANGTTDYTYKYRLKVEPALRGYWLRFVIILTPTGANKPKLEGQDFWGQDPSTGEFVEVFLDSKGGYGQGIIDALTTNYVHYRGKSNDANELYYDVSFDRKTSKQLHISYQGTKDGQTWEQRTEDWCTKVTRHR